MLPMLPMTLTIHQRVASAQHVTACLTDPVSTKAKLKHELHLPLNALGATRLDAYVQHYSSSYTGSSALSCVTSSTRVQRAHRPISTTSHPVTPLILRLPPPLCSQETTDYIYSSKKPFESKLLAIKPIAEDQPNLNFLPPLQALRRRNRLRHPSEDDWFQVSSFTVEKVEASVALSSRKEWIKPQWRLPPPIAIRPLT